MAGGQIPILNYIAAAEDDSRLPGRGLIFWLTLVAAPVPFLPIAGEYVPTFWMLDRLKGFQLPSGIWLYAMTVSLLFFFWPLLAAWRLRVYAAKRTNRVEEVLVLIMAGLGNVAVLLMLYRAQDFAYQGQMPIYFAALSLSAGVSIVGWSIRFRCLDLKTISAMVLSIPLIGHGVFILSGLIDRVGEAQLGVLPLGLGCLAAIVDLCWVAASAPPKQGRASPV